MVWDFFLRNIAFAYIQHEYLVLLTYQLCSCFSVMEHEANAQVNVSEESSDRHLYYISPPTAYESLG